MKGSLNSMEPVLIRVWQKLLGGKQISKYRNNRDTNPSWNRKQAAKSLIYLNHNHVI
jgi:hypothetical protein